MDTIELLLTGLVAAVVGFVFGALVASSIIWEDCATIGKYRHGKAGVITCTVEARK